MSTFSSFNRVEKLEKPLFSKNKFENRENSWSKNQFQTKQKGFVKNDNTVQRTKKQYEKKEENNDDQSGDFCRVDKELGVLMWKDEFQTNTIYDENRVPYPKNESYPYMKTFRLGQQSGKIVVPSTWKFQNIDYNHYRCIKCNKSFSYECSYNIHCKNC